MHPPDRRFVFTWTSPQGFPWEGGVIEYVPPYEHVPPYDPPPNEQFRQTKWPKTCFFGTFFTYMRYTLGRVPIGI